jgi:hypothetical protein
MIESLLLLSVTPAPSFDCAKATLAVERMICADPDLAVRDRALALIYENISKPFPNVRRVQRRWLRDERNACRTAACVRQAYDRRIALWAGSGGLSDYWRHESYVGGLTIAPVAGDWHVFWIGSAGTGTDGKPELSELAGLVQIRGNAGRWRQGPDCSLEIARAGRQWRVGQSPGCASVLSGLSVAGDYFTEADWWRAPELPRSRP